ncbi:ABC-type multidrug transport system fused ATPase/permease subunit [Chitinophaga niastensis]|uniref:ABC-type multidrug transport system fused ATPase/permease subunit n=1 Tax=Chitinophaga niastensis TaxID=536980 RepID=A0A2P8HHA8_CHINA|nr:ABC transporter transmembrane domain-containing protein [Chitinophaga niastensis]PSL45605.1 ABC-type multidrug transport system fused ATPase/permease subunit [Chitinophaga niastensis]
MKTLPHEPAAKKAQSATSIKQTWRLFKYLQPHWPEFSAGMFFLLLSSLAGLAFPKLLGQLIDVSKQDHSSKTINLIGLSLLGVLTAQSAFSFFRIMLFVNVSEKTLATLRQTIYNHLIQLPMNFFLTRRVGELSSRISSDITLLQETFTTTLAEFVRQIIIIVGGLTLLMMTSISLTGFMLAILPVMVIIAVIFGRFIRHFAKDVQNQMAFSNTVVEETLQGIFSVKAFANEFFEMKRYRDRTNEAARIGMKGGKYRGAFSSFIIMGIFGALVAVIWRGAVIGLDTGKLFSFVLYSVFIGSSIGGLAEIYTSLQKSIGATENLFQILDEPAEPITNAALIAPEHLLHGDISFKNISFHYPSREDTPVLQGMSFDVAANQKVALVGPSGAGKSTIVSLLLRLYNPVGGHILFDQKENHIIPLSALRAQMAVVPQDVFLFGGTIGENIAYGKQDTSEEELIEAAKKANAWEFIQRFPLGLQTIVGERGIQLSGGQRQRIAIARAVLKAPRILILDEATSALDAESERLVQDALNKLMEGRTSIVIAHRLATIRQADKIIVLDKGAIVEEGTHKELVNVNDGLYKNLSEMQFTQ